MPLIKRGYRRLTAKVPKRGNLNGTPNSRTCDAELLPLELQPDGTRKWPVSPTLKRRGIADAAGSNADCGTGDWLLSPWIWIKPDAVELGLWNSWLDNQRRRRPILSDENDEEG